MITGWRLWLLRCMILIMSPFLGWFVIAGMIMKDPIPEMLIRDMWKGRL